MKSFSILRTHTGLSTNSKIIVDSNYSLYIESIDSTPELSASRFKKVQFNKNNFYDELVPYFFKDFPVDLAFNVKYDEDNSNMSTDFSTQYDDIYLSGARNILDNKNYKEEYEYFAPLYVFRNSLPKYFIIFRIDGPGLINLTKDNFHKEFLDNFKTVKVFDLTKKTSIGEWMDKNFSNNKNFPIAPLEVDFRELEFSKWIGIDYNSGGWTSKSFYLDENIESENTLFDFEKLFLDGYRVNKIIFPHILNLSFLFDDTPATPLSLRKWSINRYAGFYIEDIELIESITPYSLPTLHSDVTIYDGNIISSSKFGDPFVNGYRDDIDMWIEYLGQFYVIKKVEEVIEKSIVTKSVNTGKKVLVDSISAQTIIKYKIISDIDLVGKQSFLNKRTCYINNDNQILDINGNPFTIKDFEFADVNIIEIDGVYHNITLVNNILTLVTDYGFKFSKNNYFKYYTNSEADGYTFNWDLIITKNNTPKSFKIYRVKFLDIKDFDTNIIDSDYSKFEYEKRNDITKTEESKMYLTDLRSKSNPQDFDDFIFNGKTEFIPVSSDYTANLETFRISDNKLSDLWRKNPIYCRWGYQNSLSAHDYPYLLNNSDIHEDYNRVSNTKNSIPDRTSRNLDYFYTINSGTTSYLHHSLHIEKNYKNVQDSSYKFELDKYLELGTYSFEGIEYSYDFSYFDIFFSQTQSFIDGEVVLNKKKYSWFETGDKIEPNTTLFRGLKFRIFEVDNIKSNSISIENINLYSSNNFENYKFSILLSSNDYMVDISNNIYKPYYWDYFSDTQDNMGNLSLKTSISMTPSNISSGDIIEIDQFYPFVNKFYQATASNVISVGQLTDGYGFTLDKGYSFSSIKNPGIWRNKMQWKIIRNWQHDKDYQTDDYIIYDGIIFKVNNNNNITDPLKNPTILSDYSVESNFTQFWNYSSTYTNIGMTNSWVYKFGEYYQYISNTGVDFWNPTINYFSGDIVIYENRYYKANVNIPVGYRPVVQNRKIQSDSSIIYWSEYYQDINSKWRKIELWDKNRSIYSPGTFVVNDGILYYNISTSNISNEEVPSESSLWLRLYSFIPDTNYKYSSTTNSIIEINDVFYYCLYNPNNSLTLDSGITIYINKKWKNILVNISINDNTISSSDLNIMDETKNIERDHLYVETNGRLTSANFIRQINDLDTLYGFSDYTSYVIIEEDGTFKKYNFNNIKDLPYFLICEEPDEFNIKNDSLEYKINTVGKNTIKSTRYLINGQIDNNEKIDFYNDIPLGVEIKNIKSESNILPNLNSQVNKIFKKFYRHSGYYMPVFYDIELFTNTSLYDSGSYCDVQFILDGLPCPILTLNLLLPSDINVINITIPFYYTGTDINNNPNYIGNILGNISNLQYNNGQYEVYNNKGVYFQSNILLGTYSSNITPLDVSIVCGSTYSITYCINWIPKYTSEDFNLTAYSVYDNNNNLVEYQIIGFIIEIDEQGFTWNPVTNEWDVKLSYNNGTEYSNFTLQGIQSELPVGTYSLTDGFLSISKGDCSGITNQFVDNTITLNFNRGVLSNTELINLSPNLGNNLEDWSNYYEQITNVISEQEIFSDLDLIYTIFEPGNPNIHPYIEKDHYVLSIKYKSNVCDLKIDALDNSCQSFLKYFFEEIRYSTSELSYYLENGFNLTYSSTKFCCPTCGPNIISYLNISDYNPLEIFISTIDPSSLCNISATSSGTSSYFDDFSNWCLDTSQHNGYSLNINNSIDFEYAYTLLETYGTVSSVGQYGNPNMLLEYVNLLQYVDISDLESFIDISMSEGIVYWCDDDGYHISGINKYLS